MAQLPLEKTCVPRGKVTLRLRRPKGLRFNRANVYANGSSVKRYRGQRITRPIKLKLPKSRKLSRPVEKWTTCAG